MKKLLKLHDHKHTAKRLEHKHTSYRALHLITFVFALSLLGIHSVVHAEDYTVSARIAAAIPTVPAQITSPSNNYQTATPLLGISGTCPLAAPAVIVQIQNNGQLVGSTPCGALGTFNIFTTLVNGQNVLLPKVITVTDDIGPDGAPVTVVYTPPVIPIIAPGDNAVTIDEVPPSSRASDAVPSISAPSPFIIYNTTKEFTWEITLSGGEAPYTITIDWGDGTTKTISGQAKGVLKISHQYSAAKKYAVIVAVTDVLGIKTVQSFAAVTLAGQNDQSILGGAKNGPNGAFTPQNIAVVTGSVSVLVGSLWLGARTEFVHFRPRFKR